MSKNLIYQIKNVFSSKMIQKEKVHLHYDIIFAPTVSEKHFDVE